MQTSHPIRKANATNTGDDHVYTAGFPSLRSSGERGCDARHGANGGGEAGPRQWSIPDISRVWTHPAFPWFEPPASGPGPITNLSAGRSSGPPVRAVRRIATEQGGDQQLRPTGRGLQESDLAALGGRGGQAKRRNLADRHGSEPVQPVLAVRHAVHLQAGTMQMIQQPDRIRCCTAETMKCAGFA